MDVILVNKSKKIESISHIVQNSENFYDFIDYTFLISNITYPCIAKLIGKSPIAYAYNQPHKNIEGFEFHTGESIKENEDFLGAYNDYMNTTNDLYGWFIDNGVKEEDAQRVFPLAFTTDLVIKFSLSSLHNIYKNLRESETTEYRECIANIVLKVLEIDPWASEIIQRT